MKDFNNDLLKGGLVLPLVENYYTLQGEGAHSGTACYFIRLGGCDVGCKWCDTKYTWKMNLNDLVSIAHIGDIVEAATSKIVVVTGGEPLMHNLNPLCEMLHQQGYRVHLETSGAYQLTGNWDWISLSPKKNAPPEKETFKLADELKVVVFDEKDLDWAEQNALQVGSDCKLYLQAEWSRTENLSSLLFEYIKNNPKWKLSLQTHKYLNIP